MKLEKLEVSKLRGFIESENYDIIRDIVKRYCAEVRMQSADAGNTYDTLRLLFLREGKVLGLDEFFDFLEGEILGKNDD